MTSNATYHQLSSGSQDRQDDDRQTDDAPLLGANETEGEPDYVIHADEVEMSVLTPEGHNPDLETGQAPSISIRPSARSRATNWWSRAPVPTRIGSAALGVLACVVLNAPSPTEFMNKTQVTVIVPAEFNAIDVESNYNQDRFKWETEQMGQSLSHQFSIPRGHEVEVTVADPDGNKIELGVALSEGIWSAKTKSHAFGFQKDASFVTVTITPPAVFGIDLGSKEEHVLFCGHATESNSALGDWEPVNNGISYRCRIENRA